MARRLLKNDEKPTPAQMKEQAVVKHPTLDFNNADFKTMSGKVTVTCTVHNTQHTNFTYSAHVKRADGHRTPCKQCAQEARANKRRIDPTEYLRLCDAKHNHRYTYHPDTYSGVDKPMTIRCQRHGDFQQQANVHLSGHGCKKCMAEDASARLRSNTAEFIDAANALDAHKITEDNEDDYDGVIGEHKYDYSQVEYGKNGRDNVKIICAKSKKHDVLEFTQTPEDHLAGKGCIECSGTRQYTTAEFIEKARDVHGDKYDYSLVEYINNETNVKIICAKHGIFKKSFVGHVLAKGGCQVCSKHTSGPEKYIYETIHGWGIRIKFQKIFPNCRDVRALRFDFYIPIPDAVGICVEYDGPQHTEIIEHWGGEEGFYDRVRRDDIKNNYCVEKGIELIRIDYTDNLDNSLEDIRVRCAAAGLL